ncbi:hypothetical protein [Sorangium sp. So ce394]|uniref:hypothetical protein n=1 Tax=Sorangium sp. So ce394 TaxID=3133310 RepID=UPI003F5B6AD6
MDSAQDFTTAVEQARAVASSIGSLLAKRRSPSISNRFRDDRANRIGVKIDRMDQIDEELGTQEDPTKLKQKGWPSTGM